jgi:hypothetical protein
MSSIERTEDVGGPEGTLIYDRRTMSNGLRSDGRGGRARDDRLRRGGARCWKRSCSKASVSRLVMGLGACVTALNFELCPDSGARFGYGNNTKRMGNPREAEVERESESRSRAGAGWWSLPGRLGHNPG